jgi:hypothetical protein
MAALAGPHDVHDRMFKYFFGAPAAMAVLLRRMLPEELLVHLDPGSLEPAPTERTSSRLAGRAGDLHFTVGYLEDGIRSALHLAVEHRSTPDHSAPLRFIVRACDIWHDHIKTDPGACATATLPVVLPLLLTQNPARNTPTRLSMVLDVPPSLREILRVTIEVVVHADDFSGSVLDDPVAEPLVLARVELARAFLHAYDNPGSLTEARMKTLAPLFDVLLDQGEPLASHDIDALLTYVVRVFEESSPVRVVIEDAIRNKRRVREMYTTIADSWFAEGEKKGRADGQARAVLGVLAHRSLFIPEPVRERVLATRDEPDLQRWFSRAFSVTTAEEIFDSNPNPTTNLAR